jgi:hypothetical protein
MDSSVPSFLPFILVTMMTMTNGAINIVYELEMLFPWAVPDSVIQLYNNMMDNYDINE